MLPQRRTHARPSSGAAETRMKPIIAQISAVAANGLACLVASKNDTKGVTAVEYGLIAGLIAVAIIAIITTLGMDLTNIFNSVSGGLQNSPTN